MIWDMLLGVRARVKMHGTSDIVIICSITMSLTFAVLILQVCCCRPYKACNADTFFNLINVK